MGSVCHFLGSMIRLSGVPADRNPALCWPAARYCQMGATPVCAVRHAFTQLSGVVARYAGSAGGLRLALGGTVPTRE